jgi:two-component system NtrC family response regulator
MTVSVPPDKQSAKLLIVDDDPTTLSQLGLAFEDEYVVSTAKGPREAWEIVQKIHPSLITLDLALEGNDPETGFSFLERCIEFDPLMKIILITGNDSQENAARAVEQGAFDFFGKPVSLDDLRILLRRALWLERLERLNVSLLDRVGEEQRLGKLLGQSEEMKSVFRIIRKVAPADVAVLILGESGTGKDLVAREIRRLCSRATKPFVSINCGAIPENLLESELFGHEKGSFTGAHVARPGKLELAEDGIVFLDEIGEVPLSVQVKLLRFLQEHEIERVGGRNTIKLDVRVIAATNRDLEAEIKENRFREDLFYRLSVVNIELPPLRERREDIPYLAQYFLDRSCAEFGRSFVFSQSAREAMLCYAWPGNVRELEHHIRRAALLAGGKVIHAGDLELSHEGNGQIVPLRVARERADRHIIVEALARTGGNVSKAALELEISRPTLHDLLRKLKLDASAFRGKTDAAVKREVE